MTSELNRLPPLIIQISFAQLRQQSRMVLQRYLEEVATVKRWLQMKFQAYVVGYVGTYGVRK